MSAISALRTYRFSARRTRWTALVAATGCVVALASATPAVADQVPTVTVNDVTVTEGDSGITSAVFTITLSQPSPLRTTIAYNSSDGSAKAPGDYTYAGGQLIFAPGVTSKTVAVDVLGDTRFEGEEDFRLNITSPSGAQVVDGTGVGTIIDDDGRPYVSMGDTSVTEGDTGTVNAVFPVTLDHASPNPVRVRYRTSNGTADSATDYGFVTGTLTIPAGQTAASVTVPVNGDTLDEGNSEYFRVTLSDPRNALLLQNSASVGTIFDDDSTPLVSILDSALVEGNSGTSNMTFKVNLSSASANPVVVTYSTANGSADTADYTPKYGTLTFTPGQTSKNFTVPIIGDTSDEGTAQYFNAYISVVSGATVSDSQAYGEIVDDDPTLSAVNFLTVDTTSVREGNTGDRNASFTVLLQPASTSTVTVNYATSSSSASAGADFVTTSGTLTIPAGSTSATVNVAVHGDTLIEGDEQFSLNLSGAVNATIDDSSAYAVILDDDVAPVASISDTTVVEGDTGTGDAAFEISLSQSSPQTVSVAWSTNNYGASAPSDYLSANGTATFQPGETEKVVHVTTNGDTVDENDEQFYVYLTTPINASITDNYGWAAIIDDDRDPLVSIADTSVFEGTTGTIQAVSTVTLDTPSPNAVTVNYSTSNGSAVAPDDYTSVSGTLTFAPGQTTATVNVPIQSDTLDENSEYLNVNISSPVNATLQDNSAYLYVLDDDTRPLISIDDVSAVEPDSGTVNATFHVSLSAASPNTVTVNYATSNGNAVAPTDYTTTNGTLTFAPGETVKTVAVPIVGDTFNEGTDYFSLGLSSASMATILDFSGYGTIFDNDPLPYLVANESAVVEGNAGTRNSKVTITLAPASPNTVTVNYTTTDGTATTANGDYVATSGTLTFAPGETSKTVTVLVNGDTTDENNEYFGVSLSSPSNAALLDSTGYITIFDDDPTGSGSLLTVDDTTVVEPDSGTTDATFTVTMTPAATSPVTVNYSTANSTAVSPADYTPQSGTLTFAPGVTSQTITVPVKGDTLDEGDEERFSLQLSALTGPAVFAESSAVGAILDNDVTPMMTINDAVVDEGNTGTVDAAFTVSLTAASPQPVWVDWDTRDGGAVAPGDYGDDGGTLYFAPGQTSKVIHVTVNGDNLVEDEERFYIDLSDLVNTSVYTGRSTGIGVIVDSDSYALLGSVLTDAGAGVNGTTLTLAGNSRPNATTTSAADGSFSFDNVPDGQYTLTPSAAGRTFVPATYTVNVRGGSMADLPFLSLTKPSVSGRIVDGAGNPVPGVGVSRTGNSQPKVTVTTNSQGYYGMSANPVGTYTIKPAQGSATFTPAQRSVTLTANSNLTANFTKN